MNDERDALFRELHERFGSGDDRAHVAYHLGHLLTGISPVNTIASSFASAYRTLIEHHPADPTSEWAQVMELFDNHANQVARIDYTKRGLSPPVRAYYESSQKDLADVIDMRFSKLEEAAD